MNSEGSRDLKSEAKISSSFVKSFSSHYRAFALLLCALSAPQEAAAFAGELFQTSDSAKCRTECIDQSHLWCASNDYTFGVCCEIDTGSNN